MNSGVLGLFAHTLEGQHIHSDLADFQQKGQCPLSFAGQGNPQRANLLGLDPRPRGGGGGRCRPVQKRWVLGGLGASWVTQEEGTCIHPGEVNKDTFEGVALWGQAAAALFSRGF